MGHQSKKLGKRIISIFLSLLIVFGSALSASAWSHPDATYTCTIYNHGQISRPFAAGSSTWTSTFNYFTSSKGYDAYCYQETASPPPNGTQYENARGDFPFQYTCAMLGPSIASSMGVSGDNAYLGVQFAIWGKYCTGSGLQTVGRNSDAQQVLNVARAVYNRATNNPIAPDFSTDLSYTKTSGDYISGSNYIIGNYTISGYFASATVNTVGSTNGVSVTKTSSNTIQVAVPLANITYGYSARIILNAENEHLQMFRFDSNPYGYQLMGTLQWARSTGTTQLNEVKDTPQGTFNIYKTDSYNGVSLANATFKLTNESTGAVQYKVTNSSGYTYFDKLPIGSYTVEETNPPAGYGLTGTTRWTGQQITDSVTSHDYHMQNVPLFGSIKVVKSAEDGIVAGRTFNISGNGVNTNVTTGADGTATLGSLYAGTYTVSEVSPPDQYLPPPPQSITVNYSTTTTANFSNILKKGYVELNKTDAETNGKLPNALFGIYNSFNIRIGYFYTNSTGYAKSSLINYGSNYYLKEETAPTGYVLDSTHLPFSITSNGQLITLSKTNNSQKGNIQITKTDSETGNSLSNAVYNVIAAEDITTADGTIRAHSGDIVDTITTAADGTASTKLLYLGKYNLQEKTAPQGYVLDDQPHNATLSYAGQLISVTSTGINLTDTAQKANIKIAKTDKETGQPLSSAVYEVQAAENITTADGTIRAHSGDIVDTITTATDGTAATRLLYLGKYEVKEKTAPQGYVLDTASHPVTLDYAGQTVTTFTQPLNVTDLSQKASITIAKTDKETKKVLADATYEIIAAQDIITPDGTIRAHNGDIVDTVTTARDGTATSKLLYLGKYEVKEKTAPAGYVLDKDSHAVTISYKGQAEESYVEPLTVTDLPQQADIKVRKTDKDTDKSLSNAVYDVIAAEDIITSDGTMRAANGDIVDTVTTGTDGSATSKLLYLGKYKVQEKTAAAGYVLDNDSHEVTLKYAEQTITTYTEPLAVTDSPQQAQISVAKNGEVLSGFTMSHSNLGDIYSPVYKNSSTLQGAKFDIIADEDILTADGTIRAQKDMVVDTVTTGADGIVLSKPLYLGNYRIVETQPPTGFVLDASPHECELVYKGQNVNLYSINLDIHDERQKAKVTLHKSIEQLEPPDKGKPDKTQENRYQHIIFGLYSEDDFFMPDGKLALNKDSLLETISPDENGDVVFQIDLPFGQYYVKELQTITGYVLDETKYPIKFEYGGDDKEKIIQANENQPIENKLIRGSLHIVKMDEDTGEKLNGAVFGRFSSTGQLQQTFTAQDGEYLIKDLPYQDGYIQELKAPDGYQLNEERYPYSITKNNQIIEIQVKDKKKPVIVDTGDYMNYPPIIFGTATSLAFLTVCCAKKRKKRKYDVKK